MTTAQKYCEIILHDYCDGMKSACLRAGRNAGGKKADGKEADGK